MISLIAHSKQSSIVGWSGHVVAPSFADTENMPDGNGKMSIVLVSMVSRVGDARTTAGWWWFNQG